MIGGKMAEITNPIKAIREYCLYCVCDQANEIKLCPSTGCPLYPFRMGKNPYLKRQHTEEQKAQMRERMMKAREKLKNASN